MCLKFGLYNPHTNVTLICERIVKTSNDHVIGHVTTLYFRHFTCMEPFKTPSIYDSTDPSQTSGKQKPQALTMLNSEAF